MRGYFLTALIFCCLQILGQNKSIDKLKEELSVAKEDTSKVWVLNDLSINYTYSFADTAVMYAQMQLQLAQKLNFKRGEAYAMQSLADAYSIRKLYKCLGFWI